MTNAARHGQSRVVASAHERPMSVSGPPPTLRDLFTMHAPYVWNTLRRLGIPASDLEDLTHDLFIQVEGHLGDFDPRRPVRPWLFGFAYRIASQHRRRAHRRRETHGDPDAAIHPGLAPDEQVEADQRRRLVLAALQRIDLERRAVFVLHDIDGTSMADIAESLRIPANTGYSRLRVAREEFAAAVKILQRLKGAR
jgi:RNA polymerase sigma-70 factor (ECF subfamily)